MNTALNQVSFYMACYLLLTNFVRTIILYIMYIYQYICILLAMLKTCLRASNKDKVDRELKTALNCIL